jgi:hypothetical protein
VTPESLWHSPRGSLFTKKSFQDVEEVTLEADEEYACFWLSNGFDAAYKAVAQFIF